MSLKVVIVGAVALGPKAACRLKRLVPDAEVTLIDRDTLVSYGGCGIPYFISGEVSDAKELLSTSFHMVRDPHFFQQAKGVRVLTRTEAVAIDRPAKTLRLRNLDDGQEQDLPYDKLVLATGTRPHRLPIPGADLERVFTIADLGGAIQLKDLIAAGQVGQAVVIGGGAIGLEMVESLTDLWGVETTLIEVRDQLLPGIVSPTLARMVQRHLKEKGVAGIHLAETALRLEGEGAVERVVTDRRTIETDLVIMAVGVRPNVELAADAGLDLSETGAIAVNDQFVTSDPDIYAGGDCTDQLNLITGRRMHLASGSLANRQGRIIGTNLAGGHETFDGIVGSFILKAFEMSVAAVGLSLPMARSAGFDALSALVVQGDRAHFYPGMDMMFMELVVERHTRRVLGLQGVSGNGDALAARIDAVAAILKYQPTVRDIANLEMAYAPPYAVAMDILNALGNTAENILAGRNRVVEPDEFLEMFAGDDACVCLDVRGPANAQPFVEQFPGRWVNIPQDELRDRLAEVPRDQELILICNSGVRSFEAQVTLEHCGLKANRNLQGGVGALKKLGWPLETENQDE